MPINYSLYENKMPNGGPYFARVTLPTSVDTTTIINKMIELGASGSPYELLVNHQKYAEAIVYFLKNGMRVETLAASYNVSMRGNFESEEDSFTLGRHEVSPTANPGPALTQAFEGWSDVQKAPKQNQAPHLVACLDYASRKKNEVVTPGEAAKLNGSRLQFDQDDPNQGIFFVNAADSTASRVSLIMEGGARQIQFKIPAELTPGSYYLQVRTKVDEQGNRLSGELPYILTAASLTPTP